MVVFGIKGGAEAGPKFIDNLNLFSSRKCWGCQKPCNSSGHYDSFAINGRAAKGWWNHA